MLERVMREIKRRTRVVGIFPNEGSCDRLVRAHCIERHDKWQCEPARYLAMEHLEREDTDREQTRRNCTIEPNPLLGR